MEELLKQCAHYPYQAGGPVVVVEDCVNSVSSLCIVYGGVGTVSS